MDGKLCACDALSKLYILYLDYDGVMHHDNVYWSREKGIHIRDATGRTLFEWASILVDLLEPYSKVKIVLSTSWVKVKDFNFAKSKLPAALQSRVIGATFHHREMRKFEFDNMSRGAQIYADVQRRRPHAWFAIDNDDVSWPAHCLENLIKTQDHLGLSDPQVQNAIRAALASFEEQR